MIREDRIRIAYVRESIGVASVVDKIRENRSRWLGYIIRKDKSESVKMVMEVKAKVEEEEDRKMCGII